MDQMLITPAVPFSDGGFSMTDGRGELYGNQALPQSIIGSGYHDQVLQKQIGAGVMMEGAQTST